VPLSLPYDPEARRTTVPLAFPPEPAERRTEELSLRLPVEVPEDLRYIWDVDVPPEDDEDLRTVPDDCVVSEDSLAEPPLLLTCAFEPKANIANTAIIAIIL